MSESIQRLTGFCLDFQLLILATNFLQEKCFRPRIFSYQNSKKYKTASNFRSFERKEQNVKFVAINHSDVFVLALENSVRFD